MPSFVDPLTQAPLDRVGDELRSNSGGSYPVIRGIPRFVEDDSNYATNFGFQWNLFQSTQIDNERLRSSADRFWAETNWDPEELSGQSLLEAGSGAGRFSSVILRETNANLASFDLSNAVDANARNNQAYMGTDRFQLAQASIFDIPFPDHSFDKVVCFGVLQHTPDFRRALETLLRKLKPGGELAVDFYPIRGFWTKIHAKYMFRPLLKRVPDEKLLHLIEGYTPAMIKAYNLLDAVGLQPLSRFLPICDISGTMPGVRTPEELKEAVVLDTFDMFSPEYDDPQRLETVVGWLEAANGKIRFAGDVNNGSGNAVVVRCTK